MKEEIKSQAGGDKSVKNMMDSMGLGMFAGEVCIQDLPGFVFCNYLEDNVFYFFLVS